MNQRDHLKRETIKHRKALAAYIALGEKRSLAEVGRLVGVSKQTAERWSISFDWQRKVEEADAKAGDRAIDKATRDLEEMKTRQLGIARAVQGIFIKRLKGAVDKDGNLVPFGYKPSAMDARAWADLEREIASEAQQYQGAQPSEGITLHAEAVDDIGIERLERIVIERVTRLVASRKRGDRFGGIGGMAAPSSNP